MNMIDIPIGKNAPKEVNVIIEIPLGCHDKLEYDKSLGAFKVDRALHTDMTYPGNYGFIPQTKSGDNDPLDCLVISENPLYPGIVVSTRPVGVLITEDEEGQDEKIVAVPCKNPEYENVKDIKDVSTESLDKIKYFFENYKKLEKGKWVKVKGWDNATKAMKMITEAAKNFRKGE